MTYLFLHLIANKTLELVYENAPECTILIYKKNKNCQEGGIASRYGVKCLHSTVYLSNM